MNERRRGKENDGEGKLARIDEFVKFNIRIVLFTKAAERNDSDRKEKRNSDDVVEKSLEKGDELIDSIVGSNQRDGTSRRLRSHHLDPKSKEQ